MSQKTKQILDVFAEKLSDIAVVEKAPKLEGRPDDDVSDRLKRQ